ncbi:MAG: AAA family ATPase [Desulfatibacillaceae bacterium]
MYYSHFGLTENPFRPTPDPRYLYLSKGHREARDHLMYGISERVGFVMVTGEVGTGKTTLLRSILGELDDNVRTALVLNPFVSETDLLPTICDEFGVDTDGAGGKKQHLDRLYQFLIKNFSDGKNAVLVLDEAQNLSYELLEQVRILSNLETERDKLLQIVLVGQNELADLMEIPGLRQLNDRIVVRYHLGPLDREDVRAYVTHRMSVAGLRGSPPFTRRAWTELYKVSGGTPRRLNSICDRALLAAFARDRHLVAPSMVRHAAGEVLGERAGSPGRRVEWRPSLVGLALFLCVAALGVAGWQIYPAAVERPPAAALLADPAPTRNPAAAVPQPASDGATAEGAATDGTPVSGGGAMDSHEILTGSKSPLVLPAETLESCTMDAKSAVNRLVRLFEDQYGQGTAGGMPGVFSYRGPLTFARNFTRPFQVSLGEGGATSGRHLVVEKILPDGFLLVAENGERYKTGGEQLEDLWGGFLVWLFPQDRFPDRVAPGAKGPLVQWVQRALARMGYNLEQDGVYGRRTSRAVRSFQREFDLHDDGVARFQTLGLLYQLTPEPLP